MAFFGIKELTCGLCGRKGGTDYGSGLIRCDNCVTAQHMKHEEEARVYGRDMAHVAKARGAPPVERPAFHKHSLPELSLEELELQAAQALESTIARHVTHQDCKSCGAQVEIPKELAIADCLFCGRTVTSGEPEPSAQPPDQGLIPFTYSQEQAIEAMKSHVRGLWLRQGGVVPLIKSSSVRKVYVPFWTFDTDASTEWRGHARVWKRATGLAKLFGRKGSYKKVPVAGKREQIYNDWLVCASHGVPSDILRQLEPFHTEGLLKAADREGFVEIPLERSALGPRQAWDRAQVEIRKNEFQQSSKDAVLRSGAGEGDITLTGRVTCSEPKGKAVVLPLYIFSAKNVKVMVNGETGTAGSSIPYSWFKIGPLAIIGAFLALVVCILSGGLAVPAGMLGMAYYWWKARLMRKRNEASFLSG